MGDRSVQVLDEMLQRRLGQAKPGLPPDPIMQCAKSLLNSVFYHLYGSISLTTMKKFLSSATSPPDPRDMPNLLDEVSSPYLHKALIRAADQLRFDCQLGLEYLRRIVPHEFGPECAMSTYEGNLLLYWYLEFAQSLIPQLELRDTLRALIDEGFAEVEDLQMQLQGHIAVIPLAFTSELLADTTVWQWPARIVEYWFYSCILFMRLPVHLPYNGLPTLVPSESLNLEEISYYSRGHVAGNGVGGPL